MAKHLLISLVTILLCSTQIHAQSVLNRLSRIDLDNRIQIYAYFKDRPEFAERLSNKRFDIFLAGTVPASGLSALASDGIIVKSLISRQSQGTNLTLFFRYIPQNVEVTAGDANTLVIDIIPGNRFTMAYGELTRELGPMLVVRESRPYPVNPLDRSEYSNDWKSMFSSRLSPIALDPPLSVLIPPFPWIDLVEDSSAAKTGYPSALIETIQGQDLLTSLTRIQNQLKGGSENSRTKYLALLHAEILFRLGNVDTASEQLNLISKAYGSEPFGLVSRYLGFLIEANKGNYYLARAGMNQLSPRTTNLYRLNPYLQLSQLETDLALHRIDEAASRLATIRASQEIIEQRLLIRSADIFRAQNRYTEASQRYREAQQNPELYRLPYALYGYCLTLSERQLYDQSSRCFEDLSVLLQDHEQIGAALYKAASEADKQGAFSRMDSLLDQIVANVPETKAAHRAEMAKIDACVDDSSACYEDAITEYGHLALTAGNRDLRCEAWLKKAVLLHLSGDNEQCSEELMNLLRTIQASGLRVHAEALLVQILPQLIDNRLSRGADAQAVMLARQARSYFENRWLDFSLLYRLLPALERLGLYRETIHMLLFLRDQYDGADQQEMLMSLTRVAHLLGDVHLVEDFSSQYFYRYPGGSFTDDIRYFRIDSIFGSGRIDEARRLLPSPLPERTDYRFLAASIFFQEDEFSRTVDILKPMHKGLFPDNQLFMLAESLYQTGRVEEASNYFRLVEDSPEYGDLAFYRIISIKRNGTPAESFIDQLSHLSVSSRDPQWQRFAAQQIRYEKLKEMM